MVHPTHIIIFVLLCILWLFRYRWSRSLIPHRNSCYRFPLVQILITQDTATRQKLRQNADKVWQRYKQGGMTQRKLVENQEAQEMLDYFCSIHPELATLNDLYHQIDRPVMKADLMRYVVLYLYGGLYADVSKFIHPFWVSSDTDAVLFTENQLNAQQMQTVYPIRQLGVQTQCLSSSELYEYPQRIFNGILLACRPRLPLFYQMIQLVHQRLSCLGTKTSTDYEVLFLTGPDIPSTVWQDLEPENTLVLSYWHTQQILHWNTSLHTGWRQK